MERTTYDRCECTVEHQIFPLLGEKVVGDITAADLKEVLNHWMDEGYAYTTVKKVYNRTQRVLPLPDPARNPSKESREQRTHY